MNMLKVFTVGDEIGGYCQGYFGRDNYSNKTCVMCAPKYAVFEERETGKASVVNYYEGIENDDCKRNAIEVAVSEEVDVSLRFNGKSYEVKFSELMELVRLEKGNE